MAAANTGEKFTAPLVITAPDNENDNDPDPVNANAVVVLVLTNEPVVPEDAIDKIDGDSTNDPFMLAFTPTSVAVNDVEGIFVFNAVAEAPE